MDIVKMLVIRHREKQKFLKLVVGALCMEYEFVDYNNMVAREAATAGNVYSYLATVLGRVNSCKFQQDVRSILVQNNLIKPVNSFGRVWLKGLVAKDPTADRKVASTVLAQHYEHRANYIKRQRENNKKRKDQQ